MIGSMLFGGGGGYFVVSSITYTGVVDDGEDDPEDYICC
jgi:hypothetical protein